MKITIDTNVLISGSFWTGTSNKILEQVENKEVELVLSKEIIEEFLEVLNYEEIKRKIMNNQLEIKRTIEKIISISTIIEPLEKFDVVKNDPDDNKVLECAVEGKVDYIISQDKHLLNLKEFNKIKIITPEEFCDKK
ncbi:MAG: putative toxin-antitoxin system toxin component, PIN family [archaeon]|nr:putative toxin-antitoxin system toxin component, PIN family [archaeon]